jgi:hypothetical protein
MNRPDSSPRQISQYIQLPGRLLPRELGTRRYRCSGGAPEETEFEFPTTETTPPSALMCGLSGSLAQRHAMLTGLFLGPALLDFFHSTGIGHKNP